MNAYQQLPAKPSESSSSVGGLKAFFGPSFPEQLQAPSLSPFRRPIASWLSQNLHVRLSPKPVAAWILEENLGKQVVEFAKHDALREIRQHYILPSDSSVEEFLATHRSVPQILLAGVPQWKACFGANAVFRLRAPIDESGVRILYAIAFWPGKLSDVLDALARFDDQWWLANSSQANGYLVFTYELA